MAVAARYVASIEGTNGSYIATIRTRETDAKVTEAIFPTQSLRDIDRAYEAARAFAELWEGLQFLRPFDRSL